MPHGVPTTCSIRCGRRSWPGPRWARSPTRFVEPSANTGRGSLAPMDVAVIGGTGNEGFGLTLRLAAAGHHLVIGSRSEEKGAGAASEASQILGGRASVD